MTEMGLRSLAEASPSVKLRLAAVTQCIGQVAEAMVRWSADDGSHADHACWICRARRLGGMASRDNSTRTAVEG
jgi:hypothetical protein